MPPAVKPAASMLQVKSQQGTKVPAQGCQEKPRFLSRGFPEHSHRCQRLTKNPSPDHILPSEVARSQQSTGTCSGFDIQTGWKRVNWRCGNTSSAAALPGLHFRQALRTPKVRKAQVPVVLLSTAQTSPLPLTFAVPGLRDTAPAGDTSSPSVQLSHCSVPGKIQGKSSSQHPVRHSQLVLQFKAGAAGLAPKSSSFPILPCPPLEMITLCWTEAFQEIPPGKQDPKELPRCL